MRQGLHGVPASPLSPQQFLGTQELSCSQYDLQEQGYISLLSGVLC